MLAECSTSNCLVHAAIALLTMGMFNLTMRSLMQPPEVVVLISCWEWFVLHLMLALQEESFCKWVFFHFGSSRENSVSNPLKELKVNQKPCSHFQSTISNSESSDIRRGRLSWWQWRWWWLLSFARNQIHTKTTRLHWTLGFASHLISAREKMDKKTNGFGWSRKSIHKFALFLHGFSFSGIFASRLEWHMPTSRPFFFHSNLHS